MTPEQAVAEQFPLDAEADIRVFNRVLATITKSCTPGSLYHPEQSARDVMEIIRSFAVAPHMGVQRPEDVAGALAAIRKIANRLEALGVDASTGTIPTLRAAADTLALPHTGQPQEGWRDMLQNLLDRCEAIALWHQNWDLPFAEEDEWCEDAKLWRDARQQARERLSAAPASPRAEGEKE